MKIILFMLIIIIILLTYLLLKKKELFQLSNSEGNNNGSSTTMVIHDNNNSQCSSVCSRFPIDEHIGNCCDCLQEHNDPKFCGTNGRKYIAHHFTENGVFCCPNRQ